jgi:hypothetical protein
MIEFKQQKVLVTSDEYASDIQKKIDKILEDGWFIVSVTAQHISTGSGHLRGGYLIVFERTIS